MKKILLFLFFLSISGAQAQIPSIEEIYESLPQETQPWNETVCYAFLNFLDIGRLQFENITYDMCEMATPATPEEEATMREQLGNIYEFSNYFCLFSKIGLIILPDVAIKAGILTYEYATRIGLFLVNDVLHKGIPYVVLTDISIDNLAESVSVEEMGAAFVAFTYLALFALIIYFVYQIIYSFSPFSKFACVLIGFVFGFIAIWVEVWPIPTIIDIARLAGTCTWWFIAILMIIFLLILCGGQLINYFAKRKAKKEEIEEAATRVAKVEEAKEAAEPVIRGGIPGPEWGY